MKKTIFLFGIILMILLSSCSFFKKAESTDITSGVTGTVDELTGTTDATKPEETDAAVTTRLYNLPLSENDAQKVLASSKQFRKIVKIIETKSYYFVISRSTLYREYYPECLGQVDCIRIADGVLADSSAIYGGDTELPIAGYDVLADGEDEAIIAFDLNMNYESGDGCVPTRLVVGVRSYDSGITYMYADTDTIDEACWIPLEMAGYRYGVSTGVNSTLEEVSGSYDSIDLFFGFTADIAAGEETTPVPYMSFEYDEDKREFKVDVSALGGIYVQEGDLGVSNVFIESAKLEKNGNGAVITIKLSQYAYYYEIENMGNVFAEKYIGKAYNRFAWLSVSFENAADDVPDPSTYTVYIPELV